MTKDNQADKAAPVGARQESNVVYLPGVTPAIEPSLNSVLETLDIAKKRAEEMGYDQMVLLMKKSDDHGVSMSSMLTDGVFDTEVIMMAEVMKASAIRQYMGDTDEDEIDIPPVS